jgi:hypothetical protein
VRRRQRVQAQVVAAAIVSTALAGSPQAGGREAGTAGTETHHYTIAVRVRPLVLFWLTRNDVGDAVMTRQWAPGQRSYSLLIGSDPDRAPMHINRWGYIREDLHGARARVVGLMTQSDEESIEEAKAAVQRPAAARHAFKAIEATTDGTQAVSRVIAFAASRNYTIRDLDDALAAARGETSEGRSRVISLPADTRIGFLAALAEAMHTPANEPIRYVYDGRLYELKKTRAIEGPDAITAEFLIVSRYDGERTRFSMTYGTRGRLADVPLRVSYQPRWWMEIELTLADEAHP